MDKGERQIVRRRSKRKRALMEVRKKKSRSRFIGKMTGAVGLLLLSLLVYHGVRALQISEGDYVRPAAGMPEESLPLIAGEARGSDAPEEGDTPVAEMDAGKKADTADTAEVISEEIAKIRLEAMRDQFPDGYYWNHMGEDSEEVEDSCYSVTQIPCDHGEYDDYYCNQYDGVTKEFFSDYEYLTQCLAFASFVSDTVFGEEAQLNTFDDYDDLRIGDHIRQSDVMHSVIVIKKTDSFVQVLEVDADSVECEISWGRELSREELEEQPNVIYLTRYPLDQASEVSAEPLEYH